MSTTNTIYNNGKTAELVKDDSTSSASKSVYDTQQLNLWYGDNHALKNIDLDIKQN